MLPTSSTIHVHLVSLVFLLLFPIGNAGDDDLLEFDRIDLNDGLSHNMVNTIFQDEMGFMWFGCGNGLNRFDGRRFVTWQHDPNNQESLSNENIYDMFQDEDGRLWLATFGGGLNCFDPVRQTFRSFRRDSGDADSPGSDLIKCLASGKNEIWLGTYKNGLNRFDPATGKTTRYTTENTNIGHDHILSLWHDGETLYVGTEQGLQLLDTRTIDDTANTPVTFERSGHGNEYLDQASIRCFYPGKRYLWIGTDRGVVGLDRGRGTLLHIGKSNGLSDDSITALCEEDEPRRLWIGTEFGGLNRRDSAGVISSYRHDPANSVSIGGDYIRSFFIDHSQNLWIGTRTGGLSKLNLKRGKFKHFYHTPGLENSLSPGEVGAITVTEDDMVWIGTVNGGLNRLDRVTGQYTHYRHDPDDPTSLGSDRVYALEEDASGRLWIGTDRGLNCLEPEGDFKRFVSDPNNPDTLPHPLVISLYEDHQGTLWAGTLIGLSQKQDDRFINYLPDSENPDSLPEGSVNVIIEDHHGIMWLGMGAGGLNRFDRDLKRFRHYGWEPDNPKSLNDRTVMSLCSHDKRMWVGTFNGGLNLFDPGEDGFRAYVTQDGLPSNKILGILPDRRGFLWLSTDRGLSRFDMSNERFRNYDIFDGLQSNQFGFGAAFREADGEMFFGGIGGFNAFRPDEVEDYLFEPPVVLSDFKVLGRKQNLDPAGDSLIELKPQENFFTLEFAALDYTMPSKNRYRYILEGVDSRWMTSHLDASASYTNLPAGSYTFKVQGSNHDGQWNTRITQLNIRIRPHLYKTWWAYSLYTFLFLALFTVIVLVQRERVRYRTRVEFLVESEKLAVEANRSKSAFLAHMSHELRTPLNAIIGYSEILKEDLADYDPGDFDCEQCVSDVEKITSSAYYQLGQVNNLLDLTRLESGKTDLFIESFNLLQLVETVLNNIRPMLEKAGNHLEIRLVPELLGEMTADMTKTQGILLNLLTNANKFTENGLITLSVTLDEDTVSFQVSDTGIGISPDQLGMIFEEFSGVGDSNRYQGQGLGLYISQQFIKLMGGQIHVESQLSKGATFTVELPRVIEGKFVREKLGNGE